MSEENANLCFWKTKFSGEQQIFLPFFFFLDPFPISKGYITLHRSIHLHSQHDLLHPHSVYCIECMCLVLYCRQFSTSSFFFFFGTLYFFFLRFTGSRRQRYPTPVLLPGNSHGRRSLVGCSPGGRAESARLSDLTSTPHLHALEKETATQSSVPAWRIPGTGEPGGLPSTGLRSRTRPK